MTAWGRLRAIVLAALVLCAMATAAAAPSATAAAAPATTPAVTPAASPPASSATAATTRRGPAAATPPGPAAAAGRAASASRSTRPAAAAGEPTVLRLRRDGRIEWRPDLAASAGVLPSRPPAGDDASAPPRARAAARRRQGPTVPQALDALVAAGQLTAADRDTRVAGHAFARAISQTLTGRRRAELQGVLADLDVIAAQGALTASRVPLLWLTLQRNVEWWTTGALLGSGQRVEFAGSELVWQHYPGHGVQIQWLGTFGKLNALWRGRRGVRMRALTDEALALATPRAGGIAWESPFPYSGGGPLWVSSLTQGTALQALGRSVVRSGRQAELLPVLLRALGIFQAPPPEGVRVERPGGAHYLQYSSLPRLFILNGYIQSLIGLHDFAALSGDAGAQALFEAGHGAARLETPTFDTGAWSLYARGTVTRESDLAYHDLLVDFLSGLCDRTGDAAYCTAERNFIAYKTMPPVIELPPSTLTARRAGALRVRLSKISRVSLEVRRGASVVLRRTGITLRRGTARIAWTPARPGAHAVRVTATDLAGNTGTLDATVVVAKAPPRRAAR